MNKQTIGIIVGAVLIAGAAFAGGFVVSQSRADATSPGGRGGVGGFAQLSETERQELQSMTEEERQAFFEEKGIDMPAGGPMGGGAAPVGAGGAPGGRGGGVLEGTVASVDAEKVTVKLASGGSAIAYLDTDTVIAAPAGGTPTLAEGASVLVFSQPEADGVNAATAIVVK